jgi:hypothetical protein
MQCTIRPALEDDAHETSAVILRVLRETNARDYTDEIIERVERRFSPSAVQQLIGKRSVFVATASLEQQALTKAWSVRSSWLPMLSHRASANY